MGLKASLAEPFFAYLTPTVIVRICVPLVAIRAIHHQTFILKRFQALDHAVEDVCIIGHAGEYSLEFVSLGDKGLCFLKLGTHWGCIS